MTGKVPRPISYAVSSIARTLQQQRDQGTKLLPALLQSASATLDDRADAATIWATRPARCQPPSAVGISSVPFGGGNRQALLWRRRAFGHLQQVGYVLLRAGQREQAIKGVSAGLRRSPATF